jgi:RNA polymerase sigma factor (sigma-70 family)
VLEQKWLQIYRETVHPLYGYMAKRTGGNRELTEDIVQESYMRALDSWNLKTVPECPLAWLKRVARNILIDYLRQRKWEAKAVQETNPDPASRPPEDAFEALEIFLAISSLGRKRARALEAFYYEGMSVGEIARIETDVRIKEVRLDSAREMAARIASLASEGLVHQEESLAMKAAAEKAALDLEKSRLNLEEVRASGIVPRNGLYAPLIGGRDFVGERIAVDKKQAELDLELLGSRLERLKKLVEKKLVQEDELNQEKVVFDHRKGILDGIQKRLGLRRQFINGELTAEEVDIQDRTGVAENNLRLAQRRVDSLVAQWKHFQGLEARGMVSSVESRQVRFALEAAEAELKLAALEIEVLAKVR